jgi:trehalose-phosphatase
VPILSGPGATRPGSSTPGDPDHMNTPSRFTRSVQQATISRVNFDGVIFDLDGVLTRTESLHARAWKAMFDEFLQQRAAAEGSSFEPFDSHHDYLRHVDGRPRNEGVQAFLQSRGIELPWGASEDPAAADTVCGLGRRKNQLFTRLLETEGARVYEHAIDLVQRLRATGVRTAVVSSSRNCVPILQSVGALDLFDAKVDGIDAELHRFNGKPAPDIFLVAAAAIEVDPARAVVFENALAGVQAGRAGGFGLVVGVDRAGQADALRAHGADVVVNDLASVGVGDPPGGARALADHMDGLAERIRRRRPVLFLDFDGTLAGIVDRPELASIEASTRAAVMRLSQLCPLAVISGRDLDDVRQRVRVDGIVYAGSHGFDIAGPGGITFQHPQGMAALPALDAAEASLSERLQGVTGVLVERKRFSVATHYRLAADADLGRIEAAVDAVLAASEGLRKGHGKKVFEIQPDIDWDKGAAVRWLLHALDLEGADVLPIHVGDDVTDEDAFRALQRDGIGIAVLDHPRATAAHYWVSDPGQVRELLNAIADLLQPAS